MRINYVQFPRILQFPDPIHRIAYPDCFFICESKGAMPCVKKAQSFLDDFSGERLGRCFLALVQKMYLSWQGMFAHSRFHVRPKAITPD
jgi:hypothetical protein